MTARLLLFLLHTVLFPDSRLPLQVFEARYLDMISHALKTGEPFGIALIRHGQEVGAPAAPQSVGTLAQIDNWEMLKPGVLHILVRGGGRFTIDAWDHEGRLAVAAVTPVPPEPIIALPERFAPLADFLRTLIDRYGDDLMPPPHRFDDAGWLGMRLAQLLPVSNETKQRWLELRDPLARLEDVDAALETFAGPEVRVPGHAWLVRKVAHRIAELMALGVLALQLDAQAQVVLRVGVAHRLVVADHARLVQLEQRLIEGLHARFA